MENSKTQKKEYFVVLKIIAIIFFVVAVLQCVLAFIKLFNFISGQALDMFAPANEDVFYESYSTVEGIVKNFVSAAMFMLWGGVLMFIYHTKRVKEKQEAEMKNASQMRVDNKNGNNEQVQLLENAARVYCAYCSNELSENDRKCPHCGASKKIRK